MTDPLVLVPYDPAWPAAFAALAARVEAVLRPLGPLIEHVGSTAVPGLPAKPVIDLDVILPVSAHADATALLATLGYVAQGEKGVPGRLAFAWPAGEPRHHLYVGAPEAPGIRQHLVFRDALRADPALRDAYAAAKQTAAAASGGDRDRYLQLKGVFIADVMARLTVPVDETLLPAATDEFAVVLPAGTRESAAIMSPDEALAQLAAFDTLPELETPSSATRRTVGEDRDVAAELPAGELLAFTIDLAAEPQRPSVASSDPATVDRHLSALDDFDLLDG